MHAACIQPLRGDLVLLYNKMFVKKINDIELKYSFNHGFTEKEKAALTLKNVDELCAHYHLQIYYK